MVINDKEKESFVNEPNDDKPTDSGSATKEKTGGRRRQDASRKLSTTTATNLPPPKRTKTQRNESAREGAKQIASE